MRGYASHFRRCAALVRRTIMSAQTIGNKQDRRWRRKAMEGSVSSKGASFEDVQRATREILPLVEVEADEGERLYHLTDRLVAEFRRTGLYMLLTPKDLGGLELPFVEAMQLVEQVTY